MVHWISENGGTLLVAAVLFMILASVLRKLIRDRKQGRPVCGENCGGCPMHGTCHQKASGSRG